MAAELFHDLFALLLDEVAVDFLGFDALGEEALGELAGAVLGVGEDDEELGLLLLEEHAQEAKLVPRFDGAEVLIDLFDGEGLAGDVDLNGVAHVLLGEALDLFAEGGGDEDGLMLVLEVGQDAADVVAEADVEHAVDFVEDDEANFAGLEGVAAEEVEDASRRSDGDVGLSAELVELLPEAVAAIDGDAVKGFVLGEAAEVSDDLCGEFAGRAEDEGLERPIGVDHLEHREPEGGGFAGTGSGLAEDVASGEDVRDHLALDVGGFVEVNLRECVKDGGFDAELGEGLRKLDLFMHSSLPSGLRRERNCLPEYWRGL